MLQAIIIDDELKSRQTLQLMIEKFIEKVKVVATAGDVLEGVEIIKKHQPEIVFLDVEMPGYSGFKLIEYFDQIDFDIVFTTAYENYAVTAFKIAASGYLLKPIDVNLLRKNIEEIRQKRQYQSKFDNLQNTLSPSQLPPGKRLSFPSSEGTFFLKPAEILFLESAGKNTIIHLLDNSQIRTTYNLKTCQEKLISPIFARIHRSFVINLLFIKKYVKGRDSYVLIEGNARIDVGKQFKEKFAAIINLFLK